jgi:hypothetical protein
MALPRRVASVVRRAIPTLKRRVTRRLERLDVVPPLWLAPPLWQRCLLFFFRRGWLPVLHRRIDLIVGIDRDNAKVVRKWLTGNRGRSAVLVLQHEGLKDADFGSEVFTQYDLVPPGSNEAASIAADWKSDFQSLCESLDHVRLGDLPVARGTLDEALQAVYRTTEIARAARVLFERGYWHVAIVMTAYKSMDGSLIEEARSCGLASANATALIGRAGHLTGFQFLTMPSVWSKPEDWITAYLRPVDPPINGSSDLIALGFSEPSRSGALDAVRDALLKSCGDDPSLASFDDATGAEVPASVSFGVVPELTTADPEALAATLAELFAEWRKVLSLPSAIDRGSWKQLGQHCFRAVGIRLMAIEESIPLMLAGMTRLERLHANLKNPDPAKVVIFDPTTWPSAEETVPALRDKVRFIPFPFHWDAADAEANRRLALTWKHALAEERAARPIEGPELHILAGIGAAEVPIVAHWLSRLEGRRAVLLMRHDQISTYDFGCDRFHDIDLIPTNSELEEDVYRCCFEHRERRRASLDVADFLGVPLSLDFFRAVAAPVERLMIVMRAVRLLYDRGYQHVALVFGVDSDFIGSLVLEGRACGVMRANEAAKRVVGTELRAAHDLSTPSLLKSARQSVQDISQRVPAVVRAAKVLVAALSSEPHFLRNGRAVIAALAEREQRLLLVRPWYEGFGWVDETGLEVATLETGSAIAARDPQELNRAADAFLRALGELAQKAISERPRLTWRELGEATSDFHDLHASGRDAIGTFLRRHLARIDLLDEIVATAGPQAIYKFPSSATTMDGSLLGIAAKYGIRQVASVFLSLSASFRDLDRAPQDVITVLGEAQAETLRSNIVANEVIPMGQPEMDLLVRDWTPRKALDHARRAMPAWDGRKRIVMVATSLFDADREPIWVRELCRCASKRGDAHVLVKLHPSTPIEIYRAKLASDDTEVSLVADAEIAPYMAIASAVVTDVSHAGKIAVYLNKPLMVVNISGAPFPYHRYDEDGVALAAFTLDQVGPTLDRVLDGKIPASRRDEFIRREFTSDDNRASDRIAELVLSLGKPAAQPDHRAL